VELVPKFAGRIMGVLIYDKKPPNYLNNWAVRQDYNGLIF